MTEKVLEQTIKRLERRIRSLEKGLALYRHGVKPTSVSKSCKPLARLLQNGIEKRRIMLLRTAGAFQKKLPVNLVTLQKQMRSEWPLREERETV